MYKFAIIGCGHIATRHAENISRLGTLVAVCDIDKEKASSFARQYGARPYFSIDELLKHEKEIDVVAVCSPNGLHAEHSIKAIQGGKHVLCEKPLCITTVAACQMIDTAYFFKRKLFVIKQNRYNPAVQAVKRMLDEGRLGKILSFEINCFWNRPQQYYTPGGWKGTKTLDGGLLYTQFSHFIDLLYWFLGDVEKVKGVRKNFGLRQQLEFEDSGVALLHMQNGAIGSLNYSINAFQKNIEGSFSILGEKGSVKIGGQYLNTLEWFDGDGVLQNLETGNGANEYGFYTGSMSNHHKVYDELVQTLEQGKAQLLEATEAIKTIEIIEKIYSASEDLT